MLAVEIDEKGHTNRDFNFEGKRQEALEKKTYDLDCEVGNIEAFIDDFKNKKNKRTRRQNKRKRRKIKQKNKITRNQTNRTRIQK